MRCRDNNKKFVILQEADKAIVRVKTCQIFGLTEEAGIVQYLGARKIQENRGKKEINYVTDIIGKAKCPGKPIVRGKKR